MYWQMKNHRCFYTFGYALLAFGLAGLLFLFLYFGPAEMLRYPNWISLVSIITSMLVTGVLMKVQGRDRQKERNPGAS